MAMGMTPEQFWDGDYEYAKHYKKAFELRQEMENESLWMQGIYIMRAIETAFPKGRAYPNKPFTLNTSHSRKMEKEERRRIERENMLLEKEKFLNFARKFNQRFAQKQQNKGSEPH